jgi:aminomethyltransferase
MTLQSLETTHVDHGASFTERSTQRVVAHYGRPDRAARAVRAGVGVVETATDVVSVTGDDRVDFVDNAISNRVPTTDGTGRYAFLLDPDGHVRTDMVLLNAGDRLLLFTPPGQGQPLAADWREKTFIEDVTVEIEDFVVFGVHGPTATEKIASVLSATTTPETRYDFVRGELGEAPATIVRGDAVLGEEHFTVVCAPEDGPSTFDSLINRGMNAPPFGYETVDALALEAGSACFATELEGRLANDTGLRDAIDFEKGCFVGQEVASRIENRGRPSTHLVGLSPEACPDRGDVVLGGEDTERSDIGEVTRALESPTLEEPIAMAAVDAGAVNPEAGVTIETEDGRIDATVTALPFVEGSQRSGRIPSYASAGP